MTRLMMNNNNTICTYNNLLTFFLYCGMILSSSLAFTTTTTTTTTYSSSLPSSILNTARRRRHHKHNIHNYYHHHHHNQYLIIRRTNNKNNNNRRGGERTSSSLSLKYWPLITATTAATTTAKTQRGASNDDIGFNNNNHNDEDNDEDNDHLDSSSSTEEYYLQDYYEKITNGDLTTTKGGGTNNNNKKRTTTKKKKKKKLFSFIRFINNIFYAMTQPFPDLRKLSRKRHVDDDDASSSSEDDDGGFAISLRLRDGLTALILYLATGVISYHYIFEKWSIIDSLYFTCVCFSTVGYGDIAPQTDAGKLFTCVFGIVGIALLGAAVATIGSRLVKAEIETARIAREQGRKKLIQVYDHLPHVKNKKHNRTPQKQEEKDINAKEAARTHLPEIHLPVKKLFPPGVVTILNAIRTILQSLFVVAIGGLVIGKFEGWSISNSIYYSLITASTIGLGDLAPTTKAGRLAAVVVIPMSVAAAGEILANVGLAIVERRQKFIFDSQLRAGLTVEYLKAMDADGNGKVDREEYVLFMLMEMGLVNNQEIQELRSQFDRLDATSNGYLDHEDLVLMSKLRSAGLID